MMESELVDLVGIEAAFGIQPVGPDLHLFRHRDPSHRIGTAVGVDQEDVVTGMGDRAGESADEGGLAGPALRIGDGDDHGGSFILGINYNYFLSALSAMHSLPIVGSPLMIVD